MFLRVLDAFEIDTGALIQQKCKGSMRRATKWGCTWMEVSKDLRCLKADSETNLPTTPAELSDTQRTS
jgi:hypothetical protein